MISIIIAYTSTRSLEAVRRNIELTIGVPFELIAVENSSGEAGLCTIYNSCLVKAKYHVLCFMHEDLQMLTPGWGQKVLEILKDDKIGLLGVAGSTYKALTPSGWACPGIESISNKVNIIQNYKYKTAVENHELYNANNEKLARVATIDGVWMCTTKKVTNEARFDECLLERFHGYDIDFSLQIASKYGVYVTFEILINHFSEGHFSAEWLNAIIKVNNKHMRNLPLNMGNLSKAQTRLAEIKASKKLMKLLSSENYSVFAKIQILWNFKLYTVLGIKEFLLFHLNVLILRY